MSDRSLPYLYRDEKLLEDGKFLVSWRTLHGTYACGTVSSEEKAGWFESNRLPALQRLKELYDRSTFPMAPTVETPPWLQIATLQEKPIKVLPEEEE